MEAGAATVPVAVLPLEVGPSLLLISLATAAVTMLPVVLVLGCSTSTLVVSFSAFPSELIEAVLSFGRASGESPIVNARCRGDCVCGVAELLCSELLSAA